MDINKPSEDNKIRCLTFACEKFGFLFHDKAR